mgnify:CR=1 FL=1
MPFIKTIIPKDWNLVKLGNIASNITKINNDLYTFASSTKIEENSYCISFDFNHNVLLQLQNEIPDEALIILKEPLNGAMKEIRFSDALYYVSLECSLDGKMEENEKEIFIDEMADLGDEWTIEELKGTSYEKMSLERAIRERKSALGKMDGIIGTITF